MPKLKTHSGAKKRMRKSATGKLLSRTCGRIHNMDCKASSRTRRLRGTHVMTGAFAKKLGMVLPDRG